MRKHQTWLWAIIIAGVIVSFVIFFTPGQRLGGGGLRDHFGRVFDEPITRREYMQAWHEVQLSYFIRNGNWPDKSEAKQFNFDVDQETRNRVLLLHELRRLGVTASEDLVLEWIRDRFDDPKRPGSARSVYQFFLARAEREQNITEATFMKFAEHEVGIRHLIALAGIGGKLLTPREAAAAYRERHEQLETDLVFFPLTNFLATVAADPAALATFYTNHQSNYRRAERVQVSFVKFPLTNHLAQAEQALAKQTNLAALLDRQYLERGPSFFTDTNGQVMTPEAAKARMREQYRDQEALVAARKEAIAFSTNLAALKPVKAENLASLAAAKGLVPQTSEPFEQYEVPPGLTVDLRFSDLAFKLTPERPFSLQPVVQRDGVYVVALHTRIPSEMPPLEAIRAEVERDYRTRQARDLVQQAGESFRQRLTNELAQGKNFLVVCTEAQVVPLSLSKFSRTTTFLPELGRHADLGQVKAAADGLEAGQVSPFVRTSEGGFVLFLKNRLPVPESQLTQELPKFLAEQRDEAQWQAFQEWFSTQVRRAGLVLASSEPDVGP